MQLTIEQAADLLGKTRRQIGYLIKTGKLRAAKVGGRWRVESSELSPSPGQDAARELEQAHLIAAVEDVLELPARADRRRYSIKDLRAFQIAAPLYHAAVPALGPEHAACAALLRCLEELARGCHRFSDAGKREAYLEARDAASQAACVLALESRPEAARLLENIEQELMAAIVGLLRRLDRRARHRPASSES